MLVPGHVCSLYLATGGSGGAALGSDEKEIVLLDCTVIDVSTNEVRTLMKFHSLCLAASYFSIQRKPFLRKHILSQLSCKWIDIQCIAIFIRSYDFRSQFLLRFSLWTLLIFELFVCGLCMRICFIGRIGIHVEYTNAVQNNSRKTKKVEVRIILNIIWILMYLSVCSFVRSFVRCF